MKKTLKIIFSREVAICIEAFILLIIATIIAIKKIYQLDCEDRCVYEVLKHEEMQETFAWQVEELTFNEQVYDYIKKIYLITTYTDTNEPDVIMVCTWLCLIDEENYIDCDIFNVEYMED